MNNPGVYTFRQIAEWNDADIDGIDAELESVPDRIRREEWWVAQKPGTSARNNIGYSRGSCHEITITDPVADELGRTHFRMHASRGRSSRSLPATGPAIARVDASVPP